MSLKRSNPPGREQAPGCPENVDQQTAVQQPGGGGAPGTGADPAPPFSPGEGVAEGEIEQSGGLPGDRAAAPDTKAHG